MADFEVDYAGAKMSGTPADLSLSTTGGTMTGPLILAKDPEQPLEAATKEYVDGQATAGQAYADAQATAGQAYADARARNAQDTNWISATLQNSWSDYDAAVYGSAAYYKDSAGFVALRGNVKHATAGYTGTMFTLPSGYCPDKTVVVPAWSVFLIAQVTITTAGAVAATFYPSGSGSGSVILSGIRFATF